MGSPFISDYLQIGQSSDQPADPVNGEPGINPEILMIRYNTDTQQLVIYDTVAEEYITVTAFQADGIDYDNATSGLAATNVQDAIDELDATVDALGTPVTDDHIADVIGAALVDGTTVNFSYNGGTHQITAEVRALDTTYFAANVIDTDTTLAADSDTRLATQKAVKAYVDAGGGTEVFEHALLGGI
jgi:hypothetical protein